MTHWSDAMDCYIADDGLPIPNDLPKQTYDWRADLRNPTKLLNKAEYVVNDEPLQFAADRLAAYIERLEADNQRLQSEWESITNGERMSITEKLARLREANSDLLTEWQEFYPIVDQDELLALIDVAEAAAALRFFTVGAGYRVCQQEKAEAEAIEAALDRLEKLL